MVFKKDLKPLTAKGTVVRHRGKGATEQRLRGGMQDSVTGPPSVGRAMGSYPKTPPVPLTPLPVAGAAPAGPAPMAPMGPLSPDEG